MQFISKPISFISFIACLLVCNITFCQQLKTAGGSIAVGVARIDITPEGPIRLAGYGSRGKAESTGIIHRLEAKALAFGRDAEHPSILITVDLVGITERIRTKLVEALSKKAGINPSQVAICASHTHGGPEIGNLLNILQYHGEHEPSDSLLLVNQSVHIAQYTEQLSQQLEEVALAALKNRQPALVAWGQGQALFAANRRTKNGPVDHELPLLRINNPDGTLKAVLVNYACHGTTLEGNVNEIHGDWIVEAQHAIEAHHPGAVAMIAIGCGGDADPLPRGKMEDMKGHGQEIADSVEQLLISTLKPLTAPPTAKMISVKLPFSNVPTIPQLISLTSDKTIKGFYARLALDRMERGEKIPAEINYPVQVWNFGNALTMINLGGEVVVDYSLRLKKEFGAGKLWINAYSNDVPCYIASRRVIQEGGYEAETSMYYYDKPSPFIEGVEDIIVKAVHEIMPASSTLKKNAATHP